MNVAVQFLLQSDFLFQPIFDRLVWLQTVVVIVEQDDGIIFGDPCRRTLFGLIPFALVEVGLDLQGVPLELDDAFDQAGIEIEHFFEVLPMPALCNGDGTLINARATDTNHVFADRIHLDPHVF